MSSNDQRPVRVCLTRSPLPPAEENIQSLPCHIEHNGTAAIKNYFHPHPPIVTDDTSKWSAEFRGVQLCGTQISLEDFGYKGLVLENDGMIHADDEGRIWEVDGHFNDFIVWDVCNSSIENVSFPSSLQQWAAVSSALHRGK